MYVGHSHLVDVPKLTKSLIPPRIRPYFVWYIRILFGDIAYGPNIVKYWGVIFASLAYWCLMVLNESQRKFAEEYVVSGNGTDAARRAGYSEHSAAQQAARLKNHEGVQRYMLELRSKKLQESIDAVNGAVMSREEVIHGLRSIAEHEDLTPSARVSAYRTIADVEGYLGKHTKVDPIAAMTGIKIEIKGADGSQVSLSTAQAVKQLTGGGE